MGTAKIELNYCTGMARATGWCINDLETTKANGPNGRQYIQYLQEVLPKLPTTKNPELLEAYLPWHPDIQKKFKKNEKIPYWLF